MRLLKVFALSLSIFSSCYATLTNCDELCNLDSGVQNYIYTKKITLKVMGTTAVPKGFSENVQAGGFFYGEISILHEFVVNERILNTEFFVGDEKFRCFVCTETLASSQTICFSSIINQENYMVITTDKDCVTLINTPEGFMSSLNNLFSQHKNKCASVTAITAYKLLKYS